MSKQPRKRAFPQPDDDRVAEGKSVAVGYFVSAKRVWDSRNSRCQTRRLNNTTTSDITTTPAASSLKFLFLAAWLITAPSPQACSVSCLYVTYSARMLAFHAPPAAVTQ